MRRSGILMHISSLPGPGGIGSLGKEAYAFADFLKASGMAVWQVLPLGPTGYGESPYQSSGVFAGNPMLISCAALLRLVWGLFYYQSPAPLLTYNALFVPVFLMAGLLCQVMAALFRQAGELKAENDLTI